MLKYSPIGITATVLTPFYYHGLYARDGSASYPAIITDTTLLFALRYALLNTCPILRDKPDYKADITPMPWRASLFMGRKYALLPPVRHTIDVSREGGFHERMQGNMGSGTFKNTFFVHEVAVDSTYEGILYGIDPFELAKLSKTDSLIVRVGVARLGMLELKRKPIDKDKSEIRLNLATAHLFDRHLATDFNLTEDYRVLDTIRVSKPVSIQQAAEELQRWH